MFVEVGEIDIFEILHSKQRKVLNTDELIKSVHTDNTAHYASYNDENDNSKLVAMWHYIHQTDFTKLSPALQTRKLHELFRYKYAHTLFDRMKNKNLKLPSGHNSI